MNILKRLSPVLVIIAFITAGFYFAGCSSAESTTGKLAFKNGEYEKAEVELKKGLQKDKNDAEGWYMLGVSQMKLNKPTEAAQSYRTAISLSDTYRQTIWAETFNAGYEQYKSGIDFYNKKDSTNYSRSFRNSINSFLAVQTIFPDSLTSTQILADSYYYVGQNDSALVLLEAIIEKSKSAQDATTIARILYSQGSASLNADNYADAIRSFDRIVNLKYLPADNPYTEPATLYLGFANYKLAEEASKNNQDFKPHMNRVVEILEPFTSTAKDNANLKQSYEILISAYDALGMADKKAAAQTKYEALNK